MKFQDVCGQEALINHMQSAIRLGKISHAYIISGEKGFDKLSLAEPFAQAMLCSNLNKEPCGECISCKKAIHHNHPDIIYISHEKPNLISAKEIREQIVNTVDIIPYESKRKIYIIEDGELINEQGQNILLKTIEDPPSYATIIILTTNKDMFLPTVLSRCVCLDMQPVSNETIKTYLMKKGIVDYQADMAIDFAEGNPGKALMIADDVEFKERRRLVINILREYKKYDPNDIAKLAERMEKDSENIDSYIDLLLLFMRDALILNTTGDESRVHFREEMGSVRDMSRLPISRINDLVNIICEAKNRINTGVTISFAIEIMLHKMKEI